MMMHEVITNIAVFVKCFLKIQSLSQC